jgi:hypothetical protein
MNPTQVFQNRNDRQLKTMFSVEPHHSTFWYRQCPRHSISDLENSYFFSSNVSPMVQARTNKHVIVQIVPGHVPCPGRSSICPTKV